MASSWILLIMMYSPGGDFIDKYAEGPIATQKQCEIRRASVNGTKDSLGITHRGICITEAHWTGKEVMAGVPLD